ncbi:cytochrome P450 [Mycena floridula]|nr:cytochrome P450 [Mycena floridula]
MFIPSSQSLHVPLDFKISTFTVSTAWLLDIAIYYTLFRFAKWLLTGESGPFKELPGPPSPSWFTGNLGQLFNAKGLPFHLSLSEQFGGVVRVHGFFGDEQLYITDPKALQSILVRDQDTFEETAVFIETNKVIFGPGLVATTGETHKRQRRIVNPIFSSKELKALVPVLYDISEKLGDVISREIGDAPGAVLDMSEWMSRVALETIGQGVLGHSFDPLDSPQNNPYSAAIKELIPTIFSLSLIRQFAPFLAKLGSPSFRRTLVDWTPIRAVQKVKEISDVMHETACSILRERRDDIEQERRLGVSNPTQKDLISVLLRANENGEEKLSETELTGQMTVLIFGAQDTTSSTLSRILFELANNPTAQDRIRDEILEKLNGNLTGRLEYEEISALPWLDAVIKETLRLYPPVPFVRRTAVKERTIPFGRAEILTIPAGTTLFVGIAGANRLEDIWGEDAASWKPERWLPKARESKDEAAATSRLPGIYEGMLSFLGGGRSCIGYRFALIEMKIVLSVLLSRYRFSSAGADIVWNLSQIIAPSVRDGLMEAKGLPLMVEIVD